MLCVELLPEVLHLVMLFALFCQTTRKFSQVFKLFFKNIWIGAVNVLPLQTLSGRNHLNIDYEFQEQGRGLAKGSGHLEEAFFERIYIDRESSTGSVRRASLPSGRVEETNRSVFCVPA